LDNRNCGAVFITSSIKGNNVTEIVCEWKEHEKMAVSEKKYALKNLYIDMTAKAEQLNEMLFRLKFSTC